MLKIDKDLMARYLKYEKVGGFDGDDWDKYFRHKAAWLVELTDGTIYCIEREEIRTSFCYGESGYDFDDAVAAADRVRTNEDCFRAANLKGIDEKIALLEKRPYHLWDSGIVEDLYLEPGMDVVTSFHTRRYYHFDEETHRKISGEDRRRILEGYKIVREDFLKRIDRYLKRYGLSKVYSWTYWRDA